MDLLSTVRKSGSRGGVNFSWDDVATSTHRENYLGHSLKAPVGRWAKGRDLNWYARGDDDEGADSSETPEQREERLRKEELRKIKEAEEDALARALGLPVAQRNTSGANAVDVRPGRDIAPAEDVKEEVKGGLQISSEREKKERRERRRRDEEDGERRERRRRHRSRSRGRDEDRERRHHRSRRDDERRRSRSRDRDRRRERDYDGRDEERSRRHRGARERSRSLDRPRREHRRRSGSPRRPGRDEERHRERD